MIGVSKKRARALAQRPEVDFSPLMVRGGHAITPGSMPEYQTAWARVEQGDIVKSLLGFSEAAQHLDMRVPAANQYDGLLHGRILA